MNIAFTASAEFEAENHTILIIDDHPTNLAVVVNYLEAYGFRLLVVQDGEAGLKSARQAQPDLILLDVMMPELDGFETVRRLKSNAATKDIPVIFMTALAETEDKIKGFQAGGVDYITKPIQQEEVLARVTTHLKIRNLTQRLQERNEALQKLTAELHELYGMEKKLRQLEEEKAQALTSLNADKDKFFSIISHDLRSPFNGLVNNAEFLLEVAAELDNETILDVAQDIQSGVKAVYNLLENLLTWSRMQREGGMKYHPELTELYPLAQEAVTILNQMATQKNIQLQNIIPADLRMYGDRYRGADIT